MVQEDDEFDWQENCFRYIRVVASVIAEYSQVIVDPETPAGWALSDLRDVNHELLGALEAADGDASESLIDEAQLLIAQVIRDAGKGDLS
jgi:hypothetical protein